MATLTLEQRLTQAEDAYHKLMMGQNIVEVVDQNGERVRYESANAYRLANYINELKRQLNQVCNGPMQVIF